MTNLLESFEIWKIPALVAANAHELMHSVQPSKILHSPSKIIVTPSEQNPFFTRMSF